MFCFKVSHDLLRLARPGKRLEGLSVARVCWPPRRHEFPSQTRLAAKKSREALGPMHLQPFEVLPVRKQVDQRLQDRLEDGDHQRLLRLAANEPLSPRSPLSAHGHGPGSGMAVSFF